MTSLPLTDRKQRPLPKRNYQVVTWWVMQNNGDAEKNL